MASTVPYVPNPAWADGSGGGTPITAAKLNTLEQGVTDAQLMPSVRVFHSTTQSIANNTPTFVAFNSERFDSVGGAASTQHDTVTNNSRLTCRYAGKYLIIGQVQWASNPTAANIEVVLNGTTVIASHFFNANYVTMNVTTLYDLAVNDFVQLRVTQASGVAVNVLATGNSTPEFMMTRVA